MSSSRKTINELASMFQDHVNWLGRYGSVPRRMALRIVNVQAGEVLDRIPRLLALERVVRRISWQWMHEAWDVVTGMTCESPRECAGTRKPIPSGMGGFTCQEANNPHSFATGPPALRPSLARKRGPGVRSEAFASPT